MEALSAQMGRLMQEKAELETRNRILEQVVKLNVDHVEQLQSHKVGRTLCAAPPGTPVCCLRGICGALLGFCKLFCKWCGKQTINMYAAHAEQ